MRISAPNAIGREGKPPGKTPGAWVILCFVAASGLSCRDGGLALLGPGPLEGGEAPVQSVEPPGAPLALPEPPQGPEPYRVRTGDLLTISVLGEPDMTMTLPVGPDGRISYYIARDVVAAGRTFEELRAEITDKLREHFKDPQVTVSGHEYRGNTVAVLGLVSRPGEYIVRSDTRLLDVIAMAGGIAFNPYWSAVYSMGMDIADLRRAFLLRGDKFVDVDFEALFSRDEAAVAANNVIVQAGDRIYIPSAATLENKVMVLGEVVSPKVVRYQRDVSFLEAIAEAGGVKESAWERRAFIVRGSLRRPAVIPISLREVAMGAAPDVPLRSGDIVYVPKTALGKVDEIARQLLPLLQSVEISRRM